MNSKPYHNFIFFNLNPSWRTLSEEKKKMAKKNFATAISSVGSLDITTYFTLGLKSYATFMLWIRTSQVTKTQEFLSKILSTQIGQHLNITYTLFGMNHDSAYSKKSQSGSQLIQYSTRASYLIIYPFTKTTDWYLLSYEKRKRMMFDHIRVAHRYPKIKQLLLYSFGVDDHEFIVSYETDSLTDFQNLVLDLRSTKVRAYTKNDLPIFTCIYKKPAELLKLI